jgi:hypothetical protein
MINIQPANVAHWFNAVRNFPDNRDRILESFWDTQLEAKSWLISELNELNITTPHSVYIFGGWNGVLASMLFQCANFPIHRVYTIDIDPDCQDVARVVCQPYLDRLTIVTENMKDFDYGWDHSPIIVINTVTEHVDQDTYESWIGKVPENSIIALQGNNFFGIDEHVRCSADLDDFKRMNKVTKDFYSGELPNPLYTRFMSVWRLR